MERSANDLMRQSASELQSAFDSVSATHGGRPVDEVKPALAQACRRHDFTFDDDDLTAYATAISEGTRIVVETQDVRL